jgi:hypothetical protein
MSAVIDTALDSLQRDVFTAGRENRRGRPRGYAPWRPQATTRLLLSHVTDVLEEYREHLPLSVRQIFYRLVATIGYPKTEDAYARLAEHLVRARRAQLISFDDIRDDGVVTVDQESYGCQEDFWDAVGRRIRGYRRDRQAGQPCYIELWCEAAGMLPQLAKIADNFSIPVYSAGGYNSVTANWDVAQRALRRNGLTVLLHVGDLDPSGVSIFSSMAADVAAFVEADRVLATLRVEAERVALTQAQVVQHELPTSPAKTSDGRSDRWTGETCQLEALAPDTLATIVKDAIIARRDWKRLRHEIALEEVDRHELHGALPQ